jgi:hypothetical protein
MWNSLADECESKRAIEDRMGIPSRKVAAALSNPTGIDARNRDPQGVADTIAEWSKTILLRGQGSHRTPQTVYVSAVARIESAHAEISGLNRTFPLFSASHAGLHFHCHFLSCRRLAITLKMQSAASINRR